MDASFDEAVILFDAVVQILAPANPDRLQSAPRPVLQPVCRVVGNDGFPIRLAAIGYNSIRVVMTLQGFPDEARRGCQINVELSV